MPNSKGSATAVSSAVPAVVNEAAMKSDVPVQAEAKESESVRFPNAEVPAVVFVEVGEFCWGADREERNWRKEHRRNDECREGDAEEE